MKPPEQSTEHPSGTVLSSSVRDEKGFKALEQSRASKRLLGYI